MIEALTERMQRSATGFGAVIDGVLDIRTVSDSERVTAMRAMSARGIWCLPCPDEGCDCMKKAAEALGLKIVAVSVEATP